MITTINDNEDHDGRLEYKNQPKKEANILTGK